MPRRKEQDMEILIIYRTPNGETHWTTVQDTEVDDVIRNIEAGGCRVLEIN